MGIPELEQTRDLRITFSDAFSAAEIGKWLSESVITDSKILLSESTTDALTTDFPLNSKVHAIAADRGLEFLTSSVPARSTIISTPEDAYCRLRLGDMDRFVAVQQDDVIAEISAEFDALATAAEPVEFDMPTWPTILEELEETVGPDTRAEFERLIEAARMEDMGALDVTSVAIIAAAQSGALNYDLGKWAEHLGIASRATISRSKTSLEDDGIIYTEKVPQEIGRPKLRLQLSDEIQGVEIDREELDISRGAEQTAESPDAGRSDTGTDRSEEPQQDQQPKMAMSDTPNDDLEEVIEEEIRKAIQSN